MGSRALNALWLKNRWVAFREKLERRIKLLDQGLCPREHSGISSLFSACPPQGSDLWERGFASHKSTLGIGGICRIDGGLKNCCKIGGQKRSQHCDNQKLLSNSSRQRLGLSASNLVASTSLKTLSRTHINGRRYMRACTQPPRRQT